MVFAGALVVTARLGSQAVTVLDAPLVVDARYGSHRRDWDNAVATDLTGCSVQPYTSDEDVAGREFTATRVRLFTAAGPVPVATSRVVVDGTTFEVDGEPARWVDGLGRPSHVEVVLKRLAG